MRRLFKAIFQGIQPRSLCRISSLTEFEPLQILIHVIRSGGPCCRVCAEGRHIFIKVRPQAASAYRLLAYARRAIISSSEGM